MQELKPCPFCGGEAHAFARTCDIDTPYNPADRAFPVVRCKTCYAEAPGLNWTQTNTAILVWNTRAMTSPLPTDGDEK